MHPFIKTDALSLKALLGYLNKASKQDSSLNPFASVAKFLIDTINEIEDFATYVTANNGTSVMHGTWTRIPDIEDGREVGCLEDLEYFDLTPKAYEAMPDLIINPNELSSKNISLLFRILSTNWGEERRGSAISAEDIENLISQMTNFFTINGLKITAIDTGETTSTHAEQRAR